jgi:hypothetical protein
MKHPQTSGCQCGHSATSPSGHRADIYAPLFRPLKHNGKRHYERHSMDADAITA